MRVWRGGLATCVSVLALAGCAGPVDVDVPSPTPDAAAVCSDLAAALPTTIGGQDARPTAPASDLTAAWGDPAIVLRCGVPTPDALAPTSQLVSVDGIDWFPEELSAGYVFTTYGRTANVEVTVPDEYAPEAGPLTSLTAAVRRAVPRIID